MYANVKSHKKPFQIFVLNVHFVFTFLKLIKPIIFRMGVNGTLRLPETNNISLEGHLKIPNDFKETHTLIGKLNYGEKLKFIDYLLKYRSTYPIRKYGSWAEVKAYYVKVTEY